MKVAIVRATKRQGWPGFWAAGRFWGPEPKVVTLVDDEFDPEAKAGEPSLSIQDFRPMEVPSGRFTKTGEPIMEERPTCYVNGASYLARWDVLGTRSFRALRETPEFLTVETRTVNALADIKIDAKTGLVEETEDLGTVASLQEQLRAQQAEVDAARAEAAAVRLENEQLKSAKAPIARRASKTADESEYIR